MTRTSRRSPYSQHTLGFGVLWVWGGAAGPRGPAVAVLLGPVRSTIDQLEFPGGVVVMHMDERV